MSKIINQLDGKTSRERTIATKFDTKVTITAE